MPKEKLNILHPILVEGRYDRAAILGVANATVITTDGFGVFKSCEKKSIIKALTREHSLIILTDSDKAGAMIRSHIRSFVPKERLISLYIPQIKGKEKRKSAPSAEGTLGVEGMSSDVLYSILLPYSVGSAHKASTEPITKTDFFNYGLSGGKNSSELRDKLAACFSLPCGMTANALLEALNLLTDRSGYEKAVNTIKAKEG